MIEELGEGVALAAVAGAVDVDAAFSRLCRWVCGRMTGMAGPRGITDLQLESVVPDVEELGQAALVAALAAVDAAPLDVGVLEPVPLDLAELDGRSAPWTLPE